MWIENLVTFIELGIRHVIPMGLDHMLFVAGLCISASSWRSLLILISGFTLAHSATLALATLDLISIPSPIIEAGIALSIMVVGIEIIVNRSDTRTKFLIVSAFGLVHGLGFATMIKGYLLGGELVTGLIGFNVGVEIAQLVVVAIVGAVAIIAQKGLHALGQDSLYRPCFLYPCAAAITLGGAYMLATRTGLLSG